MLIYGRHRSSMTWAIYLNLLAAALRDESAECSSAA
jgi:hypothetical protein